MKDIVIYQSHAVQAQADTIMIKVSDYIYNVWQQIAQSYRVAQLPLEDRQKGMYGEILRWVNERYPGYGLIAFEDLSLNDAHAVSQRTGKTITWGMYLLLQRNGTHIRPVDIYDLLEAPEGTDQAEQLQQENYKEQPQDDKSYQSEGVGEWYECNDPVEDAKDDDQYNKVE